VVARVNVGSGAVAELPGVVVVGWGRELVWVEQVWREGTSGEADITNGKARKAEKGEVREEEGDSRKGKDGVERCLWDIHQQKTSAE